MSHKDDFSRDDSELALGYIYGLRTWNLLTDSTRGLTDVPAFAPDQPVLRGLYGKYWTHGVNVAKCAAKRELSMMLTVPSGSVSAMNSTESLKSYGVTSQGKTAMSVEKFLSLTKADTALAPLKTRIKSAAYGMLRVSVNEHSFLKNEFETVHVEWQEGKSCNDEVALDCSCGFYAYYSLDRLDFNQMYDRLPRVYGLIRAHGRVTQGEKGFRAQKAEILSLFTPALPAEQRLRLTRGYEIPTYLSVSAWLKSIRENHPDALSYLQLPPAGVQR